MSDTLRDAGDGMPNVKAYLVCAECKAPFVLRLCFSLATSTSKWLWQRDCKHKKAASEIKETKRAR